MSAEEDALPTSQQRAALASSLLLQTPPGQIASVYADLSSILFTTFAEGSGNETTAAQESSLFQAHATRALEAYNTEQLIPFKLPGSDRATLICRASQLPHLQSSATDGADSTTTAAQLPRYLNPFTSQSFAFDHFKLVASDIQPFPFNPDTEPLRVALQKRLDAYLANHFPDGVGAVFVVHTPPSASQTATAADSAPSDEVRKAAETAAEASGAQEAEAEEQEKTDAVAAVEATEAVEADIRESEAAAPPEAEAASAAGAAEAVEAEQSDAQAAAVTAVTQPHPEWAGAPSYVIHVTGNRFNPQNYWAGRWRSSYTYTPRSSVPATGTEAGVEPEADASPLGSLRAHIALHVHYYEEGNVQLHLHSPPANSSASDVFLPLPSALPSSASSASKDDALSALIFNLISKHEGVFQRELSDALSEQFAEKAMRSLRRALPITRQRVDWDKLVNYKLGSELGKAA
ncbi:F-actin-capping protein subunit alpha [Tilletia horrida]|uniref:F-actin-capping protein subunit alpha n=1 Tax=Tilletia horrida TaxID=155126 RepID=A0AAN6H021_9BASI|nr:F-actin-capping protein subunit alpha [Tilletia horrida]KAK0556874.1 F-actin-capping protein subunit alpha [Tilletia horrida]KAK0563321.1 F-actin-capping protein subunit alpha [Tilletia horrida]